MNAERLVGVFRGWLLRRISILLITIFTAISINFFLLRIMPGNPIDILIQSYIEQGYGYEEAAIMVQRVVNFIPTKPLWEQYIDFLTNVFQGNLGKSMTVATGISVGRIIAGALPWTVFLLSISVVLSFAIGVLLGMYMAYNRNSLLDRFLSLFASITSAIPQFVLGLVLVLFLAYRLNIFPTRAPYSIPPSFSLEFVGDLLYHAALPVMTYVITTMGGWMLTMKSNTISVLGEYYVLAAEARGLPKRRITITYVGRNAILPLFTRFAITFGYMFGGSVFIERIFAYPGIGKYISLGLPLRDYTLLSGLFLITTITVVFSNFIADLLYGVLDPRVRVGGR